MCDAYIVDNCAPHPRQATNSAAGSLSLAGREKIVSGCGGYMENGCGTAMPLSYFIVQAFFPHPRQTADSAAALFLSTAGRERVVRVYIKNGGRAATVDAFFVDSCTPHPRPACLPRAGCFSRIKVPGHDSPRPRATTLAGGMLPTRHDTSRRSAGIGRATHRLQGAGVHGRAEHRIRGLKAFPILCLHRSRHTPCGARRPTSPSSTGACRRPRSTSACIGAKPKGHSQRSGRGRPSGR